MDSKSTRIYFSEAYRLRQQEIKKQRDLIQEQAQQIAELQAELEQVKDLLHQHECSGDITSSNKSHNEIKADGIQECFEYTTEKNPLAYSCSQAVADVYNIAVEYAQKLRKQSEDKG